MRWIFLFEYYAAAGWLLETVYALLRRGRLESRKTLLFLPLCPVYGLGGVLIVLLPEGLQQRWPVYFLASAAAAAGAEYLFALFFERCWQVRFWDYRPLPCQLHGRICLPFALLWGLLAFPLRSIAQPAAEYLWQRLSPALVTGLAVGVLADFICTTLVLEHRRDISALRWWVSNPPQGAY